MNEKLSQLIKQSYNHPENSLSDDIWYFIQEKYTKRTRLYSYVYCFLGILSLGSFVFVFISAKNQFIYSGFFQYLSLAFSDSSILAYYWKEYLLSLADSIPFASLVTLSFLLFTTLVSFRKTVLFYKNQLLKI